MENSFESGKQQGQRRIKICFIDNGPGIAAENLANIFDPFFTTKDPGKGTGLGLSVSFMIIDGLGGKMTGTSEPGMGTTMIINLPLCTGADKLGMPPGECFEGGAKEGLPAGLSNED